MTERFEIENLIEEAECIRDDLEYEAASRPGEGPEFEAKLLEAKKSIDDAIEKLKDSLEIWDKGIK